MSDIDAVAAEMRHHTCIRLRVDVWDCLCGESFPYAPQYTVTLQEHQAQVLSDAGWLRTAEDRALSAVADKYNDRLDDLERNVPWAASRLQLAEGELLAVVRARRVAAGGTAKVCNAVRPEDCNGEHCDCAAAGGTEAQL